MAAVSPEEQPKRPQNRNLQELKNKACFFTISDFVEDRVRVRCLNIVAFTLIYIYFVFALLKTVPRPEPQVKLVRYANPPPASWLSGNLGDDLRGFYSGLGMIPNRSQRIFVVDDTGTPMINAQVEVKVTNFVAEGPLPCSKAQLDAMASTIEARRLEHVCKYDEVEHNTGATDPTGLVSFSNFTIKGPAGLYTVVPSVGGVDSTQEGAMLVSTPVASMEVVDDTLPEFPPVPPPLAAKIGEPFAWQPRVLVRDMRGLPVPGRKVVAFANPDPTWPIMGPSARTPEYDRRGQKVVELNCPESELSGDRGIAQFTCLGVKSSNVDHVNIVFSDSALVFYPWNDPVYSPRSAYPLIVQSYRYSIYIVPNARRVQVDTPVPGVAVEGIPFNPPPVVNVTDENGSPLAGVTCYAYASIESGGRNPNWYRRQLVGVRNKELLDAVAITDASGKAEFTNLRWSVEGNTMDLELLKFVPAEVANLLSVFSISFNCEGIDQDTHAWSPWSGSFIWHVEPIVAEIRIKRFIRKSAEMARYLHEGKADGSDTFLAVVRVVDDKGNGIPGKTVDVKHHADEEDGRVTVSLLEGSIEQTNDLGFAVVAFQAITGPPELEQTGSFTFQVRFLLDGATSQPSEVLTARLVGGVKPEECHIIEPGNAYFYRLSTGQVFPLMGFPVTVSSGDIFFSTNSLIGATSCVTFPSISTPNTTTCTSRRLREEDAPDFKTLHRRLKEADSPTIGRKLLSADGSMAAQARSVYSSVTDKWGKVRFEPRDFLEIAVLPQIPLPSLREYNANPQFPLAAIFNGPSGDHWVRMHVETTEPDGTKRTCSSRMIPVRIENDIGDIEVHGDGGPGSMFEDTQIEAGGYIDIDVRLVLDNAFVNASNLSNIPECIRLSATYLEACTISFVFRNAPFTYHQKLGLSSEPRSASLLSEYHAIFPVQKTNSTNTDGFDPTTGTLHLRFQMLEKGIFGDFGIQFSGFGVKSRVFTWRVKPPPGLRLEVVQDPGYSLVRPLTGNLMDILPKVKVLSDSGPVNGAILAFEAVPEEGGRFEKLTEVPLYSAFPFLYSEASGKAAVDGFGQSLGPAEDGLAYFPTMGMPDGSGCARFRFLVGGVSSPLVPATPICCEAAFEYSIVNTPPSSWPLKMELQDFGGAITVELSPRHELPQFTEYLGGLLVRLVVSGEGGQDITDRDMAFELSQRLLSDSVCVFLNRVEQLGRCSNLEVVQTHPFPVLRFSFLRVTWMRAMSLPGKMKLRVSDLSGSGFSAGEALPAGFADMNSVQKFAICAAAASASKELLEQSMTSEIVAETTASQYMVVLPPPETVTVGSMFLVRLKVTTASGGPVRDVRVRVGIKSLTTTAPGRTSPGLLQSLAVQGNSLGVVSTGNIKLDPLTTVRSSDGSGIIGFPLTVLKAGSGTYQLQFQPDVPDGKIVLTTSAFKVENPITAISSSSRISEMKIPKFGTSVPVPVAPQFCIETATNESLQQMDKDGIRISIVLRLKAAPEERESAAMSLVAQAKRDANEQAQRIANDMATRLAQTPNTAMRRAVDTMVARANSKAKGMFAGMSEEFAEACFATPAKLLQTGDPAVMVNFGNATVDFVGEQAPSLAEALGMDPTALDPTQSLNQFTEVLMSAGAALTPAREMAVEGSWELTLNDLDFKGGCTYEPNQSLVFPFKEGMDYSFSLSVNGVEGPSEPFKVLLIPADPVDLAFNWFLSAVAAIVGVVLLTTNVTLHHWAWFVIAMLCTLGMCIGLPWMTLHKDAMYGSWLYIAIANFALIAVALVWGLTAQLSPKIKTFEDKRADIFEEYTHRQFKTLIGFNEGKRDPRRSALRDTFLKPFNSQDAFFFPSAFLIASFLSFLSFIYVLMQSIQVLNNTEKLLQQILNTAVDRSVLFVSSINNAYFQALGADLPDSSSDFMYVQIQVMKDWFQKLITSIVIGFTTGIVVAAILTVAGLLGGFVHFRQSVMDARRGKFNFKKSDAKLVFATAFIGINISSSIVSFILIVGLVTLVTLPFTFELTWRVIWSYAGTILLTFVLPAVIKFLSTKILKGCIFGPTFIKTRAGASIFHFYTTFLALPGGVVTAIVRFVMGLLSVLVMLPITYGANTPNMVNSVMLLDSSYKTYIAYVMLYATHNNPIMITAARRLLAIKEAREKHREEKKHWTSSRSLLILILIRFPHLRQYRKHVLEEERKLQKILKDKKYAKSMKDKKGEESENVFIKVQEGSAKVEEPWIANAYEDALQDGIKIQRKIELMKKYRTMLSGLQEDTPEYKEMKDKLRELSLPLRRDSPVLGV